jgi:uncharacterized protein YndB with AHSA1/START domain
MSKDLLFDFTVDKATKMVYITREFDAELSLVWDAFTDAALIDQWIAPRPMIAKTKYQDFKVGGKRFYAMISPQGDERWAIQEYTAITPMTHFAMNNAFADKDENPEPHGSVWEHRFSEAAGKTTVHISIYNESLERLERILEGFTIGMRMSLSNLEELLIILSKK